MMMIGARRLRTLIQLAERVDGAAYVRVREAIRQRIRELEREGDDLWDGPPLPPDRRPLDDLAAPLH